MKERETMNQPPSSDMTALTGGTEIGVRLRSGGTEKVRVLELAVEDVARFLEMKEDEAQYIELYTGKPAEWVKTVHRDSQVEIIKLGEKLNLDFFAQWLARKKNRLETLFRPREQAEAEAPAGPTQNEPLSPNGPPRPQSSAS